MRSQSLRRILYNINLCLITQCHFSPCCGRWMTLACRAIHRCTPSRTHHAAYVANRKPMLGSNVSAALRRAMLPSCTTSCFVTPRSAKRPGWCFLAIIKMSPTFDSTTRCWAWCEICTCCRVLCGCLRVLEPRIQHERHSNGNNSMYARTLSPRDFTSYARDGKKIFCL